MILNALVVPSVLVLLLDYRCFRGYLFPDGEKHVTHVTKEYCGNTRGTEYHCDPNDPNDGWREFTTYTTFEYPWRLSEQCGSAVVQSYAAVVMQVRASPPRAKRAQN